VIKKYIQALARMILAMGPSKFVESPYRENEEEKNAIKNKHSLTRETSYRRNENRLVVE
jgi:hypothetical protein